MHGSVAKHVSSVQFTAVVFTVLYHVLLLSIRNFSNVCFSQLDVRIQYTICIVEAYRLHANIMITLNDIFAYIFPEPQVDLDETWHNDGELERGDCVKFLLNSV